MVSRTRNGGGGRIPKKQRNEAEEAEAQDRDDDFRREYEESRALRIKQNSERMKSLGLFDLSNNLISKPPRKPRQMPIQPPSDHSPRRSSRLKDLPRPTYVEKKPPKKEKLPEDVEICIAPGENPEIYTEEDEKLLGDSKAVWELGVDGFDEEGQRVYDPILGKSCHQCRQKTLGRRTECSSCKTGIGQFCGDCLYMRYGENVTEVNLNPTWVCPVCRGICNCSRCRRDKGWAPTAQIFRKVVQLGFKSVAHYLIHTYRGQPIEDLAAAENPVSVEEGNKTSGDAASSQQLDAGNEKEAKKDQKPESDQEYEEGNSEDDGEDDSESESFSQ